MESEPAAKSRRHDTDYKLCIICQSESDQSLIAAPSSHEKILDVIRERTRYGCGNFSEISRRLGDITHETLKLNSATWHRQCYQDTVHAGMCKLVNWHYGKKLSQMSTPVSYSWNQSPSTFTHSQSVPYNKYLCFFYECPGTYRNPLHKVSTTSADQALNRAIEKSKTEKLHVKLCTLINPEDAHAIDIRYHKRCWATHVSNVDHKKARMNCIKATLIHLVHR